jgi:hypothetical protein
VALTLTAMVIYRTGGCWGVTIVEFDDDEPADDRGHRPSDRLVAMARTVEDADMIVRKMNSRAGQSE